jgi:hypothetical protein
LGGYKALNRMPKYLLLLVIGLLMLDTLVAAAGAGWLPIPEKASDRRVARRAVKVIVDYYRQMARSAGVHDTKAVNKALKDMERGLRGKTISEIMVALVSQSHRVEAAIGSEKRRRQREIILKIIEADQKVRKEVRGTVLISDSEVLEGKELLSPASIKRMKEEPILRGMTELITIEISNGKVKIISPPGDLEYYQSMALELEQVEIQLQRVREASGEVALKGAGVIIQAADAPNGYLWEEIVHEQDIREIVNTLYFAGAKGVEVGGQRLGTGGWVRCVGPVVVVNGKTVAANPIVIKAVGRPKELRDSLGELQEVFGRTGKRLDITGSDEITLLQR